MHINLDINKIQNGYLVTITHDVYNYVDPAPKYLSDKIEMIEYVKNKVKYLEEEILQCLYQR